MSVEPKLLDQFDELLHLGETVLKTKYSASAGYLGNYNAVNKSAAKHWGIKCLSLLEEIFGEKSLQYTEFKNLFEGFDSIQGYSDTEDAHAVLKAAKEIYERGIVTKRIQESDIKTSESSNVAKHLITGIESEAKRNTRIYLAIISIPLLLISISFFYFFEIKYASLFTIGIFFLSYLLSFIFLKELTPTKLPEKLFEYEEKRLLKKFGINEN